MAIFSRLVPTISTAYAVQSLAALIFVPQQQDKYYDFTGALGFLSSTFVSLYYPALKVLLYPEEVLILIPMYRPMYITGKTVGWRSGSTSSPLYFCSETVTYQCSFGYLDNEAWNVSSSSIFTCRLFVA